MAQKKKSKAKAKKATKRTAKRKTQPVAKKARKQPAKKKSIISSKKKTKSTATRKVKTPAKKTKRPVAKKRVAETEEINSVPNEVPVPEVIKHEDAAQSSMTETPMHPDKIEEHKISEHQFENREHTIMNQENQRVKAALANRQSMKRVFRTPRHP